MWFQFPDPFSILSALLRFAHKWRIFPWVFRKIHALPVLYSIVRIILIKVEHLSFLYVVKNEVCEGSVILINIYIFILVFSLIYEEDFLSFACLGIILSLFWFILWCVVLGNQSIITFTVKGSYNEITQYICNMLDYIKLS